MRNIGLRTGRRLRGATLGEMIVASGCTVVMLAFAFPAFQQTGDAGDEGASRVLAQAETRHALLRLARELENSSTTARDPFGNLRLTVVNGDPPAPLADKRSDPEDLGEFFGVLGDQTNLVNSSVDDNADDLLADTRTATEKTRKNVNESMGRGSGARVGSRWGRVRSGSIAGTDEFSDASFRPRHALIPLNSILIFQKVTGYSIGADGAPAVEWGAPIEYRIDRRRLLRTENGRTDVVSPCAVGFRVQLSDAGTVIITLVSQRRANSTGRITAEANQVEVSPKN